MTKNMGRGGKGEVSYSENGFYTRKSLKRDRCGSFTSFCTWKM